MKTNKPLISRGGIYVHKVRRTVENGRDNIQCACAVCQMGASQSIDVCLTNYYRYVHVDCTPGVTRNFPWYLYHFEDDTATKKS